MEKLEAHAKKKNWITADTHLRMGKFVFEASLDKVARKVAQLLKPDRRIVSAVRFADGTMVQTIEDAGEGTEREHHVLAEREAGRRIGTPAAAVSVAAPVRGCPAPDFAAAELKARAVLAHFLLPQQVEDFRRFNRFMSTGATTGGRYMITSRHARDQLANYQRSLFDLERNIPLCVHDWAVPAAEEMLALHVLLQLRGGEAWLRGLSTTPVEPEMLDYFDANLIDRDMFQGLKVDPETGEYA